MFNIKGKRVEVSGAYNNYKGMIIDIGGSTTWS